jgi:membrane protein
LRKAARRWRDVLLRIKDGFSYETLSLTAAGVAFFAFLSLFPAITALLSIYGLVAQPSQATQPLGSLPGALPAPAIQVIQKQMHSIAQGPNSTLGISLIASIVVALYSASKGARALVSALNIAYDEVETRGFIRITSITLLLTLASIALIIILFFVIGLPGYLPVAGLPTWLDTAISVICWLLALALVSVALAVIYAWVPNRARPRIQWVTPGALVATLAWLLASLAFSFYISHFSSYNKIYGSTAAIVILMLWFWVSALVTLIGAEINAALEMPGAE